MRAKLICIIVVVFALFAIGVATSIAEEPCSSCTDRDRITLDSGTLNGITIDPSDPVITVSPGESITGTLNITSYSVHGPTAIFLTAGTPTWGDHASSYFPIGSEMGAGTFPYTVNIDETAPDTPGTYYIATACAGQTNYDALMSVTAWFTGVVWDDGNDVADWDSETMRCAIDEGCVYVLILEHLPDDYIYIFYGAAAIRVRVAPSIIPVSVDIKPQSCPNPFNTKSKGVLPVAILGTEDFDVTTVDPATVLLEGAASVRNSLEDVSRPVDPREDICDCTAETGDGYLDMTLKFDHQEILAALEPVSDRDTIVLTLTGMTYDSIPIEGQDCVVILSHRDPRFKKEVFAVGLGGVEDLTFNNSGTLFVGGGHTGAIKQIDFDEDTPLPIDGSTLDPVIVGLHAVFSLPFDELGDMFVSEFDNGEITKIDFPLPESLPLDVSAVPPLAYLTCPDGMTFAPPGSPYGDALFVGDVGANGIFKVYNDGTVTPFVHLGCDIEEVIFSNSGDLIFAISPSCGQIFAISPDGSWNVIASGFDFPDAIAQGPGNAFGEYLYVGDLYGNTLFKVNSVTGERSVFAIIGSEFGGFEDIVFDNQGNMFILGFGRDGQIIKISPIEEGDDDDDGPQLKASKVSVPKVFALSQNYPNPFNPQTTIRYALVEDTQVRLVVYNVAGQEIKTLVNEGQEAGYHECVWDGKDVASGIYFYRLQAGDFVQTRKMVVLK